MLRVIDMLEKVKSALTSCPCDGAIYLVHKLSDCSGFFMFFQAFFALAISIIAKKAEPFGLSHFCAKTV